MVASLDCIKQRYILISEYYADLRNELFLDESWTLNQCTCQSIGILVSGHARVGTSRLSKLITESILSEEPLYWL